jgi:hypothetical protein
LGSGGVKAYLINHNADNPLAAFRFKYKDVKMYAAEKSFEVEGKTFNAGTFVIKTEGNPRNLETQLQEAGKTYGFTASAVAALPDVSMHELAAPRIALVHDWMSTQSEGWTRIALDDSQIPYDYVSVHEIRDNAKLRDKYDVILFGPSTSNALSAVSGLRGNKPLPWKKTELTPNLGRQDSTEDMRGGIELEGVLHLRDFINEGGLLITLTSSSALPIHFGLAQGIRIKPTEELWARGGVYQAEVMDSSSPIVYGYDDEVGVYFNSSPVFAMGSAGASRYGRMRSSPPGRVSGRGSEKDPDIPQGRAQNLGQETIKAFQKKQREEKKKAEPKAKSSDRTSQRRMKTILRFVRDEKKLLISGGLAGGKELAGAPAIVDCKLGKGHVVLFSINPMWRHQTHGSFFFVFNAMLNYNNLDIKK